MRAPGAAVRAHGAAVLAPGAAASDAVAATDALPTEIVETFGTAGIGTTDHVATDWHSRWD